MRRSLLLAGLAGSWIISSAALADSDLDHCRFVGELSKTDQNIAACDNALNDPKLTGSGRATALSNRCGWWWAKKEPERALLDCNEAIRINSGYAVAYVNRGNVYLSKAEPDRAFGDFNEAIRLDPKNAWAYSARGSLYKNKGDLDHALSDLNESIRLDPNYAMARFFRGDLYKSRGDLGHATADLNESIRLDPNYAAAYFTRGSTLYLTGNNAAAIEDFTKSIKLDATDAASYFNRGVAYFVIGGRIPDAEADFKKANELNPKDAYAAIWLDLAERRNGVASHLAANARQLDMTVWPAPLVQQFLGTMSPDQTFAAAFDNDPRTRLAQTCESNFYGGEFASLMKNRKEALRQLQLAANDCPRNFIESTAAIAELILQRQGP